jgi:hypothetical protein
MLQVESLERREMFNSAPMGFGDIAVLANQPPVANDDSFTIREDHTLTILPGFGAIDGHGILTNDREFDGDGAQSNHDGDQIVDRLDDDDDNDGLPDINDPATGRVTLHATRFLEGTGTLGLGREGSLSFFPPAGFSGTVRFAYVIEDIAGTLSNEANVTIQVLPVNDEPIIFASHVIADPNAGPQTIRRWASIFAGGSQENDQIVTATITNVVNPQLLAAGPELLPDGTLRFTPVPGARGMVAFRVRVMDNGGTANGGDDTFEQTFFIEIGTILETFRAVDGNLIIETGDSNDSFDVFGTGVPGQFTVLLNRLTLIPYRAPVVDGITGDIRISTRAGDDRISLNNVFVAGNVFIDTGAGDDLVQLGSTNSNEVSTARDLSVILGDGDDWLVGANVFVRGNQSIDAGAGNDQVYLAGIAAPFALGTSSAGATIVQGGDGDDVLNLVYSFIVAGLTVDGGTGVDSIQLIGSAVSGPVTVDGGDHGDLIALDTNFFVSGVSLDGASGDDRLLYANNIALAAAQLNGGAGNDAIEVRNVMQRELRITADTGGDNVDIRSSLFESLFADLGDSDDQITLFGNLAHGTVELHGGLGLGDRLLDLGNSFRSIYRKRTFEFFA